MMFSSSKLLSAALLSLAFFISAQAQDQHKIDSLKQVISTAKEDTAKASALDFLGWELRNSNPDSAIILANQALTLSKKYASTKHIAYAYRVIGWAYLVKGNYPASLENNFKALSLYKELDNKARIAKTL